MYEGVKDMKNKHLSYPSEQGVWQIDKAGNITRFYPTPKVGEVIECPMWIKALLLEQHPYMFPQEPKDT